MHNRMYLVEVDPCWKPNFDPMNYRYDYPKVNIAIIPIPELWGFLTLVFVDTAVRDEGKYF